MSILVVGSVAFDSIETPHGKRDRCLGGAATYFALAASYFTKVRVIAVVGEDFTAEHEAVLTRRGVDTQGLEHTSGKSFQPTSANQTPPTDPRAVPNCNSESAGVTAKSRQH